MIRTTLILLFTLSWVRPAPASPAVALRPGLVITTSVTVKRSHYRIHAPVSLDSAAITVRGDHITVDFAGSTLDGSDAGADPDGAAGVGIRIDGGRDVRIINATVRGYRFGILARGVRGLDLSNDDVSGSWKPRLFSTIEHESLIDWLSFHRNDNDEWLRYGAGIYLSRVSGGNITGSTGVQGMNGLLMTRCDHLNVHNNNFSFNSGLGMGLYRSSNNTIVHNRLEYNIRGYSHGVYARGQDSADLLLYEQSDSNVVAYNSATHGGDGLFLWAGQTTMDSGTGGANDNLFYGNDFSFAPANGIEATFSRNSFVANHVEGNTYGVWGGFSFESAIIGNTITHNRIGIAIEHGQDNTISSNLFDDDTTAIYLWANPIGASDWGYPKHRDTRSRNYRIEGNAISHARRGLRAFNTDTLTFSNNPLAAVDTATIFRDTASCTVGNNSPVDASRISLPPLAAGYSKLRPAVPAREATIPSSELSHRGRSAIIVDEWGPYDWKLPKLVQVRGTPSSSFQLLTLGPPGSWRVVDRRGTDSLSSRSGKIGDTLTVTPSRDSEGDWALVLEYRGRAGRTQRFSYNRFDPVIDWNVGFFAWTDSLTDPRAKPEAFGALLRSTPLVALHAARLDYEWYRPSIPGIPDDHFAAQARGSVTLGEGTYTLRTISDDAIRVWVDDSLVIDDWKPHESEVDFAPLTGGRHDLRVQYVQVDGYAELRLDILKGVNRSAGSPPPHGN